MESTSVASSAEPLADTVSALALWRYGSPVLLVLGTVCNVLVLCVMLQKQLRGTVSSLYLSVLAIVDLMCLYTGLMRHWIANTFGVDVRELSDGSCRVHPTLVYFALQFEAWILVNLTVERFTSVYFPLEARSLFTVRKAALGLLFTGLVAFVINIHYLIGEYYDPEKQMCQSTLEHFEAKIWPWLDLIIVCFLPFAVMISLNVAVIYKIYRSKQISKSRQNTGAVGHFKITRVNQLTITLLVVSLAFFVTTLPLNVHLIIANINYEVQDDLLDNARDNLIFAATNLISYVNNVINFFLYCFSGRKFRKQLCFLFKRSNVIESSTFVKTIQTTNH